MEPDELLLDFPIFHAAWIVLAVGIELHGNIEFITPIENAAGESQLDQFVVGKFLFERVPECTRYRVRISGNALGEIDRQGLALR